MVKVSKVTGHSNEADVEQGRARLEDRLGIIVILLLSWKGVIKPAQRSVALVFFSASASSFHDCFLPGFG